MCTQCPSSRWSATSHARDPGRPPGAAARRRGRATGPRQLSHPGVAGPGGARREHLELRIEVAPDGGVVDHGDPVLLLGVHREAHAQRHGDGVAEDEEAHGVRAVGPGVLQRGVLRAVKPGGRGKTTRVPAGPVGPGHGPGAWAGDAVSAGRPGARQDEAGGPSRPRTPQRVTPAPSSRCPPPSPGRQAAPDRSSGRAAAAEDRFPRARLLLVGRSRPPLEYPPQRPQGAGATPPLTQSATCMVTRGHAACPSAAPAQVARVPAGRTRGRVPAPVARRSRPRRRPRWWAGGRARPS